MYLLLFITRSFCLASIVFVLSASLKHVAAFASIASARAMLKVPSLVMPQNRFRSVGHLIQSLSSVTSILSLTMSYNGEVNEDIDTVFWEPGTALPDDLAPDSDPFLTSLVPRPTAWISVVDPENGLSKVALLVSSQRYHQIYNVLFIFLTLLPSRSTNEYRKDITVQIINRQR